MSKARSIKAHTLDATYYRARIDLCMELANAAKDAKCLRARLIFLADEYLTRAKAAAADPSQYQSLAANSG